MYVDARKFKYGPTAKAADVAAQEQDKKFAAKSYREWVDTNAEAIVDRLWEIDDIGVVERIGEFVKLLKEAEYTYSLAAYISTIALIGVCAEDLCRFFATESGHNLDSLTQNDRIDRLGNLGLLTATNVSDFHSIRRIRNDCLHYNQSFKTKSSDDLKADALMALNTLKRVYANIIGVTDYNQIDPAKLIQVMDSIVSEISSGASGSVKNMDDATIRLRNVMAGVTGLDLSVGKAGKSVMKWSEYEVMDIDLENEPPEISLRETHSPLIVIVDLGADDVVHFENLKLQTGDKVVAAVRSVTNGLGMTGEWRFVSLPIKIQR